MSAFVNVVPRQFNPYEDDTDNRLAKFCQLQIFMALVLEIALRADPENEIVASILLTLLFLATAALFGVQEGVESWLAEAYHRTRQCFGLRRASRATPSHSIDLRSPSRPAPRAPDLSPPRPPKLPPPSTEQAATKMAA
jgi:hypothetical protein